VTDEQRGATVPLPPQASISLSPEDFWRLRALIRDVEGIQLQIMKAQAEFENRLRDAVSRRDSLLTVIGHKYSVERPGEYVLNDETCSLQLHGDHS
jgi:hypothetical protein